ncbi:Crp/Fnr family transcriptional regulator [Devosia sp. CAU 1758]
MISRPDVRNLLLAAIPEDDFSELSRHLEPLDLPKDFRMSEIGRPMPYAYFPEAGIGSVVFRSPEGQSVEAGIFGRDGFGPTAISAQVDRCPCDIFMQVSGHGFRIETRVLRQMMAQNAAIQQVIQLSVYLQGVQTSHTALSNAVHHVNERLARWLLMCHDRWDSDEIPITHEFISLMLAVRRPSVTTALHVLEGNHLIKAERGNITIRDRTSLEEFAADAYGAPENEYRRLLGVSPRLS